jgi:hypothetical protein
MSSFTAAWGQPAGRVNNLIYAVPVCPGVPVSWPHVNTHTQSPIRTASQSQATIQMRHHKNALQKNNYLPAKRAVTRRNYRQWLLQVDFLGSLCWLGGVSVPGWMGVRPLEVQLHEKLS